MLKSLWQDEVFLLPAWYGILECVMPVMAVEEV